MKANKDQCILFPLELDMDRSKINGPPIIMFVFFLLQAHIYPLLSKRVRIWAYFFFPIPDTLSVYKTVVGRVL